MLSWIVNVSSRLNSWNTKPRLSRRKVATSLSFYPAKLLAVEHDRAAGRLVQRRKKIQKRRFARAGLAHYGDVLALIDAEVYVLSASTWFPPKRVLYTFLRFSTVKMLIVFTSIGFTRLFYRAFARKPSILLTFPPPLLTFPSLFRGELTQLRIRILRLPGSRHWWKPWLPRHTSVRCCVLRQLGSRHWQKPWLPRVTQVRCCVLHRTTLALLSRGVGSFAD